jgi:hypothetical protein
MRIRKPPSTIYLKSRRFIPRLGIAAEIIKLASRDEGPRTLHVLVQPADAPDTATKDGWAKELGLRLLDPIPEDAFFASVPADVELLKSLVREGQPLRMIAAIEPADKVSFELVQRDIPEHARGRKGVRVVVLFFGDVDVSAQQHVLARYSVTPISRIEPINGWQAEIPRDRLQALAAEDEVKWIEAVPPPIELDNDGVRGATGVNADAVLAAPYGLTGAGVTVGQWESTHASLTHPDFAGRIILADGPVQPHERTVMHTGPAANYSIGEAIYIDMDDSGSVSEGDIRVTSWGAFVAGTTVVMGDADEGTALAMFAANEWFADPNNDGNYAIGDAIYRLAVVPLINVGSVSVGDTRLTATGGFLAGSVVVGGDADIGTRVRPLIDPHYHSTHVAGTVIGSGPNSAAQGGSANQWKGVAPGATLRSYRTGGGSIQLDYVDAAANGTTLSTNSWGYSHMHDNPPSATGYEAVSALYDAVVSGRRSDGTPSGLVSPILIVASSGNEGRPERHTENVANNGQFNDSEAVYVDVDDSGAVSASDAFITGAVQPNGTALGNFQFDERHTELTGPGNFPGTYQANESIYRDVDGSGTVSMGDVRLAAVGAFPAGSVVSAGDPDVGQFLRQFRLWGNVRVPNSAKNTVVVANIASDTARAHSSSSRGPTLDGRLKPDISGPGWQASGDFAITSTQPRGGYAGLIGTSMSTPAVAGSLALVTERYRALCASVNPPPHTLRALLLHAAEDLTTIPNVGTNFQGPDFAHGYGRARVKEAVDLIPHHRVGAAAALGDTDFTVVIGAMVRLKVTLAWDDPAFTMNAAPSPTTGMLQNDLDLVLIAPDGTQHTPWVLNPQNPFEPATCSAIPAGNAIPEAARDRRNTVEQVVVDNAAAGTWTIRVTASQLSLGPQSYTLVSEVIPPQASPCAATPAGDVWMRDNIADTGGVSTGTMWLSPDLWNRTSTPPDGMTSHQNPEYGQVNYLYANLRNRTATAVHATSVDVWLAPASTGLAWPASFSYVGRFAVPNMGPNEVRQIGPLPWDPPSPMPSNHYCFYVRVASPQDPITYVETASVPANAQASNNIVWRNINVVDLQSTKKVSFQVRNIALRSAEVELVVRAAPELLRVGKVHLQLSPELERRLGDNLGKVKGIEPPSAASAALYKRSITAGSRRRSADAEAVPPPKRRITEPEVRLPLLKFEAEEAHPITLSFFTDEKQEQSYDVEVVQEVSGKPVGGILYQVRSHR